MPNSSPRMRRERNTLQVMIRMYCRDRHAPDSGSLCPDCQALQDYALLRLEKCPFQAGKTTCARCPVHCYKAEMRERVRRVMRYAGPRMLLRHPWLAFMHLWDGRRKKPLRAPAEPGL